MENYDGKSKNVGEIGQLWEKENPEAWIWWCPNCRIHGPDVQPKYIHDIRCPYCNTQVHRGDEPWIRSLITKEPYIAPGMRGVPTSFEKKKPHIDRMYDFIVELFRKGEL